jgi:surfactin synthase thioesterase subunit
MRRANTPPWWSSSRARTAAGARVVTSAPAPAAHTCRAPSRRCISGQTASSCSASRAGGVAGAADDVLREAEELALPSLRADFELVETVGGEALAPIACAVQAFGGISDPMVSLERLRAWRDLTTGPFALRMIGGDHFFPQTARAPLLREKARGLERHVSGPS